MTEHTVDAPGATIHYDIHPGESPEPPLVLLGSPQDVVGFGTLLGHFTDRTVVAIDPRGAGRSKRTDGATETTPEEHADDLGRVIEALDAGPVDVFGTSGGAFNALALLERRPELVRTLVAHEPPAATVLPDAERMVAVMEDIRRTYDESGTGPAMAKFIALVMFQGELPADYLEQPAPDPATFGLPTTDDGSRDDPLMLNMIPLAHYEHDFEVLRTVPTRIVIGVGEESAGEMPQRGGIGVAQRLGLEPVEFPGGHGGFLGGEYGQMGKPDEFAARLREVLAT